MNRRGFLGALSALPFVGKFVESSPVEPAVFSEAMACRNSIVVSSTVANCAVDSVRIIPLGPGAVRFNYIVPDGRRYCDIVTRRGGEVAYEDYPV